MYTQTDNDDIELAKAKLRHYVEVGDQWAIEYTLTHGVPAEVEDSSDVYLALRGIRQELIKLQAAIARVSTRVARLL